MKRSETIYGMHAVRVMLERHAQRVLNVRLAEQRGDARVREIEELAHRAQRPVQRVDMHSLRQQLGDVAHQGVAAEITPIPPWGEDELLEALQSARAPLLLALDGVQDPHNLGACLRSADACGALAVIVPRDRAAQLTPAVRKVAAGAAETTPVVSVTNLVRTFNLLKKTGFWIVGADAAATTPARHVDLTGPAVLVLGAEGSGLRHLTRQNCDFLVSLPQRGAVESLNVSVAAAMLLYEALRQRDGA
ncbi:MAG TPA: 23S rRNA (guanosine(2251)-2'-O)-methyltransferase RlmB [Steroidobacteraceae bacterium]